MWLHLPASVSTSCPSVREGPDSTWDLNSQCQALAPCVWSRGKPSQSRDWLRRCKTAPWLTALFGQTPEPSKADAGVEWWIWSPEGPLANHIRSPESALAETMNVTYGQSSGASSFNAERPMSLSKTSKACSPTAPPSGYGETFDALVTRLRSDSLRRRKLARRTFDLASLSLGWPTPAARDHKGANGEAHLENGTGRLHMDQLPNFVAHLWRTPEMAQRRLDAGRQHSIEAQAMNSVGGKTPEQVEAMKERGRQKGKAPGVSNLNERVMTWSTPRATDGESGSPNQSFGAGGIPLAAQTIQWWNTPSTADGMGGHVTRGGNRTNELLLNGQAIDVTESTWKTPRTVQGLYTRDRGDPTKERLSLDGQASSLQVRTHVTNGAVSPTSAQDSSRRSLNPFFVEWLMGWPMGWAYLGSTRSGFLATEWSRWWLLMRFALSQLPWPDEEARVQQDLFA